MDNKKFIQVEVMPIEEAATMDLMNINKHTQRGRGLHENSMQKRGAGRSIFSAGKGVEVPVVMGGNQTFEIGETLGMEVINVYSDGTKIVNVVRTDIAPGSPEFYAMAIEDNAVANISYNPDIEILAAVMADPAMQALKAEDDMLSDIINGMGLKEDDNYSRKIEAPIYTPKGEKPTPQDLFDDKRAKELLADIEATDLPEDEKEFLRIAARRHTVINFKRVADYYAHSPAPVQKLMEDSALVIIDFERAIELGYVKLSEEIAAQYLKDYPDA